MTYVEELARAYTNAIVGDEKDTDPGWWQAVEAQVHEFLAAIAALAPETGVKLVRREPTEAMLNRWPMRFDKIGATNGWHKMFDAAPAVPEEEKKVR